MPLSNAIGGLPSSDTPLNPKITGIIQCEGFRIENVIYESRPNTYVTANLYVPEGLLCPVLQSSLSVNTIPWPSTRMNTGLYAGTLYMQDLLSLHRIRLGRVKDSVIMSRRSKVQLSAGGLSSMITQEFKPFYHEPAILKYLDLPDLDGGEELLKEDFKRTGSSQYLWGSQYLI